MIGRKICLGTGRNERGFTLLELMVVMGLMGIFALVAVRFSTRSMLDGYRLKEAARDLYSTMQQARMNAIKANRAYAVRFDTSGAGSYWMESLADDGVTWNTTGGTTVNLTSYEVGVVAYGFGPATQSADGGVLPGAPVSYDGGAVTPVSAPQYRATFDLQGFSNGGYCYLTGPGGAYAVGTFVSGAVKIRKWDAGTFK